jgi:hypothetical protein
MLLQSKLVIPSLLLVVLSLVSCLGPSSPKAVVERFNEACAEGDLATADELLSETSPLFGAPCFLRRDADKSSLQEDKTRGNTASVVWEWRWKEPFRLERQRFHLSKGKDGWRIDYYELMWEEYNVTSQDTESIPAPTVVNQDPELLETVAYIEQGGIDGTKVITTTARIVNGQVDNQVTAGERILQEPRATIVVVGTKSRAAVLAEIKQLVVEYFTAYHAPDYNRLSELTHPEDIEGRNLQAAHQTAGMAISEFNVDEVKQLRVFDADSDGWWRSEPRRNSNLPGEPYVDPFVLEAEVPVFVRYQIFGIERPADSTIQVVYRSDLGWKIHHWGPWAASAPAESQSWDQAEIRLDGVALYPNGTLVVATRVRPQKGDMEVTASDDTGQGSGWGQGMEYQSASSTASAWLDALHPHAINVTVRLILRPEGYFGDKYEMETVTLLTR